MFRCFAALFALLGMLLPGYSAELIERHYDIVFIVDESASMGRLNFSNRKKSDPDERRIDAINLLPKLLFDTSFRAHQNQDLMTFRYCVIKFGTEAVLEQDWLTIDYGKNPNPPATSARRGTNMYWTNYLAAFDQAMAAFKSTNYGYWSSQEAPRELLVLFLTDGRPSLKNMGDIKPNSPFWGAFRDKLDKVKTVNPTLRLNVLAFHNPETDEGAFWSENRQKWEEVGANLEVFQKGEAANVLPQKLRKLLHDLYPVPNPPSVTAKGVFNVPCLVETLSYDLDVLDRYKPTALISPSGERFEAQQVHRTRAQGRVTHPEPGEWVIENYQQIQSDMNFAPLLIPYSLVRRYPGPDLQLFSTPMPLRLEVVLPADSQWDEARLEPCQLRVQFAVDMDEDGKADGSAMTLLPQLEQNRLVFQSANPYKPPIANGSLMAAFSLEANGQELIAPQWRRHVVIHKKAVVPVVKTRGYLRGSQGYLTIKLGFQHHGKPVPLAEVFEDPSHSFEVWLKGKEKQQVWVSAQAPKSGSALTQTLLPSDPHTLAAQLSFTQLEAGAELNWLSGWLARLLGHKAGFEYRLSMFPEAQTKEDVTLQQPPKSSSR